MAAAAGSKAGINASAYRNTGTFGLPTWTAVGLIRTVTPGGAWDFADASARETRVKLFGKTQVDLSGQMECRADDADTAYVALLAAAMSQTAVIDFLILNGPITKEGASGFRGEMLLSYAGESQGLGDNVYTQLDYKPAWTSNGYPKSVVMGASSAPTFTAF